MSAGREEQPLRETARAGASRLRLLEHLRQEPAGLGVHDLALRTGLHENTVRFHLDRLVADGLAGRHRQARTGPGRPRLVFTAVPRPDLERDRRSYRLLAEMLAGFLPSAVPDATAQATQLGQAWGGYLANRPAPYRRSTEAEGLAELLRVLDEVGFAPDPTAVDTGHAIRLRHCPFLEVAEAHRDVVCAIHLGLMHGVLDELHAPLAVERLQPFAEPAACLADVRRTAGADADRVPVG